MCAAVRTGGRPWRGVVERLTKGYLDREQRQRGEARILVNLGASLVRVAVFNRRGMQGLAVLLLERQTGRRHEPACGDDRGGLVADRYPVDVPGVAGLITREQVLRKIDRVCPRVRRTQQHPDTDN